MKNSENLLTENRVKKKFVKISLPNKLLLSKRYLKRLNFAKLCKINTTYTYTYEGNKKE